MKICAERASALGARAARAQSARLAQARRNLDGLARVLESVSHKSVLERGFALVRGPDGSVRHRVAQITNGESLTLTFADGDAQAQAGAGGGKPRAPKKKPGRDQGSLF